MKQKKSICFRIFKVIASLLIILTSIFFIYVSSYYKAGSLALNSLKSDAAVEIQDNGDLIFKPVSNNKNTGFIFYPGAKVEASAYAPIAKEIASNGYTVVIAKMSFNLAILSPNKADNIISSNNEISNWIIGGHSLGGVFAADYALKNDKIKGLVLLASYSQKDRDFTNRNIKVLSLWGDNDKVADLNKVKNCKSVMPSDSEFKEIKGGNHGGFGDYGHQKGDGEASISNEKQMSETSEEIIKLLDDVIKYE
jgi:hypothetical protein